MAKPKPDVARTMLPLRFDPTLVARIKAFAATQQGMSMNAAVAALLDRALAVRGL